MTRLRAVLSRWPLGRGRRVGYAILDVESTGLSPESDHVVEIAIVTLDARRQVVGEWSSLVCPPGEDELGASHIHGITREMVRGAPRFFELCDAVLDRLGGRVIVGHVVAFDLSLLRSEFARAGRMLPELAPVSLCTRELARLHLTARPRTLERCCEEVGISLTRAHRALDDARATAQLFSRLGAKLRPELVLALRRVARDHAPMMRAAPSR